MTAGNRVLVTGAGGNLGGHVARLLAANGYQVYGTSRKEPSSGVQDPDLHWLTCDLSVPNEVRAAVKSAQPSLVMHTVGLAGDADLKALVEANVMSTANLLEALDGWQVDRLLVVGSGAEYAASDKRELTREDHALAPASRYGLSKLFQYELSQMALKAGVPIVYARPFNLIGPGVSCATAVGDISKRLAKAMRAGGTTTLEVGDLDRWRDYLDVRDAAAACRILLESAQVGDVYNVCSGVPVLLADVVDTLLSFAGREIRLHRVDGKPSMKFQVGDPSKLRALGWSATYDLETSLRDGLHAYLGQRAPE